MDYVVRTPDQLAKYLKALRQAAGESQALMAGRLGISQARYSAIELKPEKVAVEQLLAVLANLGVDLVLRERADDQPSGAVPSAGEW